MKKIYALKYGILLLFICFAGFAQAQNTTLTGKILDEKQQPLPGASVLIKNTTRSTSTDVDGNFRINGFPTGKQTVVITFIGYQTIEREIDASQTSSLNVEMKPSAQILDEIAVIGYGIVKKSDATGAVDVVSSKNFNKGVTNSPQELIAGKIAGVSVTSISGAPGNTSTIRIRGGASLSASNDPLIVIDGVPIENVPIGGSPNILSTLNPNDIESFTVLKDASATAIYGSRASNGVIQITTKRGGKDLKIGYNLTTSLSTTPNKIDVYTGDEFRELVNRVYAGNNAVTSLLGTDNTDWQSQIYKNAFTQDHNLSFSGTAWKKLPYRISGGYNNADGVLKTYNYERTTLNVGLNPSFLKDHLKFNVNFKGLINNNNFADQGAVASAVFYDPTKPVYNGNTRWRGYTTWTENGDINGNPITLATPNPVAQLDLTDNTSRVKRSIGNIQTDYKFHFLPELRANLNLGYDYAKSEGHNNVQDSTQWVYVPVVAGGRLNNYSTTTRNQLADFYLNYAKDLKSIKSRIDVTAGYSWSHFYREGVNNTSALDGSQPQPTDAYKTEYYLAAFFGRLNYSYNDKYLLTFTLRDDATSRFSPDTRWGLFPAGAFAWRIKNEDFLKNSNTISDLKLRLGYGVTGQQDLTSLNNYPYLAKYTISDATSRYKFGDTYYYTLRPDGYDANIKWESTNTLNAGIDFGFANNRITGAIDYYSKKTSDLLSIVDLPAGTNFSPTVLTNIGSLDNHGIEFSLNSNIIATGNFNWSVNYNISYNKTKITKLNLNDDPNYVIPLGGIAGTTSGTIQAQKVGYPANSFYVYKQVYDPSGNPIEDKYVDLNNDGVINTSDLYIYKKPTADVLMGISTNLTYKHWDFSATGRASLGNYVYNNVAANSTYRGLYSSLRYLSNQTTAADETQFTTALTTNLSDYYIQNASFFRLDNMVLGYRFAPMFSNKFKLRLSASVQNVFVITDYKGLDPEISGGLDNNFYPRSRTFQLGLNAEF
ncbi:SusC/RagA family TonB-linked outer membrane protein [Pedobacter sp. HMF7647]|uniref:SusC/RagA family TonB-linked outer membrane protein n=1 Tax=Hufsiella arboris TaxID=2695275 RepID=A0A7K1YCE1_9SPHI|nr:TonB-dependent receptor [Hufsiella arboris]MXV52100.1 SusC/RagA family TonB-linked outer membrane protein [Hufsiella arboris]